MQTWQPLTLTELNNIIHREEKLLVADLNDFWHRIKISPEKWKEEEYGKEGGGFWVVAIYKHKVIWYNDIEEGFNISDYKILGQIEAYACEQDELRWAVRKLSEMVK
ncbi:MAG: hypothetical protein U0U66_14170 [Cytophagaceae bacterium]